MIRVNIPFQSPLATGLTSGMRAGENLVPDPLAAQREKAQTQLLLAKAANLPQQQAYQKQMNALKMALIQQQVKNAQTTPFERNMVYLSGQQVTPQTSSISSPTSSVPSLTSPSNLNLLTSSDPSLSFNMGLSSPFSNLNLLNTPNLSLNATANNIDTLMSHYNPLQQAYIRKYTGYNPQQQAFYKERAAADLMRQRGKVGQDIYLANAPDNVLINLGYSPNQLDDIRRSKAAEVINSLPKVQQNQWVAGTEFMNHFNKELRPATLKFMKELHHSGIQGISNIQGSKLATILGKNKTLYDDYQNLMKQWSAAASDYRRALGDNATNQQLAYISRLTHPDIATMSIPGILQGYNNLVTHTDQQLNTILNNTQLRGVKNHINYTHPQLFNPNAIHGSGSDTVSIVSPSGEVHTIPYDQLDEALSHGFKMVG